MQHPAFRAERREEAARLAQEPFRRRSVFGQLALFVLVLGLWQFPIINPIKLLVVLFHEMAHVVAAYATGGVVFGMAIDPGGAGVTLGMEGDELVILLAGYAGSFLLGVALYALVAAWTAMEVWCLLILLSLFSLSFGWLNDFTQAFGYGAIILLVAGLLVLRDGGKKFFLRIIATTCCLYPLVDVAGEYFQTNGDGFLVRGQVVGSDVARLADLTGLPEGPIAAAFIAVGVIGVIFLIDWSAKKDSAIEYKASVFHKKKKFEFVPYRPNDPSAPIPELRLP